MWSPIARSGAGGLKSRLEAIAAKSAYADWHSRYKVCGFHWRVGLEGL
jgi:hypothetical protein